MAEDSHVVKSPKITITPTDEQNLWEADWAIRLTDSEEQIGTLSFRGEKVLGAVPLTVELQEQYRGKGYGSEAISMMVNWAFHFRNIYEVKAETDRENDKAVKAMKKAGFVFRNNEGRTEYYSITKPKTAWTGLYLFIGVFIGLIFGIIFAHLLVSLAVGVIIGVSIGGSMDLKANKEREQVTGKQRH